MVISNKFLSKDLPARLHKTILNYDGIPYFVHVIDGDIMTLTQMWEKAPCMTINARDPKLDMSSVSLGYFNSPEYKSAIYAKRAPLRRYKQGVCTENTKCYTVDRNGVHFQIGSEALFTSGYTDSQAGKFPTLASALSMMDTKEWVGVALSKDVAICNTENRYVKKTYFKTDKVGEFDSRNNVLDVPNSQFANIVSYYLSNFEWSVR